MLVLLPVDACLWVCRVAYAGRWRPVGVALEPCGSHLFVGSLQSSWQKLFNLYMSDPINLSFYVNYCLILVFA